MSMKHFGRLPIETQKAINNLCAKDKGTSSCEDQIAAYLRCLKRSSWDAAQCPDELLELETCSADVSWQCGVWGGAWAPFASCTRTYGSFLVHLCG